MKFRTVEGDIQVSFECTIDPMLCSDKWFSVDILDGMYCLLLNYLHQTSRSPESKTKKLNIKRRRTLIYIRRAIRHLSGRKLPLQVVKQSVRNKPAKLSGYTIIG